MIRTQIQLTEEQARRLRELSAQTGRSMADIVRESVDDYLARRAGVHPDERRRRALQVVGRFASGSTDVARDHDRYLGEIYGKKG